MMHDIDFLMVYAHRQYDHSLDPGGRVVRPSGQVFVTPSHVADETTAASKIYS